MPNRTRRPLVVSLAITVALALALAACGSSSKSSASTNGSTSPGSSGSATLRLGYFPNVTHAPAIIGAQSGSFAAKLGPNVKLELKTFNSGTEATTALLAGAIDASFVGPNPAINAYQKTGGGDPHRVRHRVGRRGPRGEADINARPTSRARRSRRRSSATPRTSRCAPG